jgi:chitinase
MNGQVISQQTVQQAAYRLTVNMNNNVAGVMVVQLNDNAGWNEVKKIVF